MVQWYDELLKVTKAFGEKQYAEDLVQELYIHVHGRNVTKSYCISWLKWRAMDLHRARDKYEKVELPATLLHEETPFEVEKYKDAEFFDLEIFNLWAVEGMSIRQIAKETKISPATIQASIKKFKNWYKKKYGYE